MRLEEKYRAGLAHLEAGRLEAAESALRSVAAANPRDAAAHYHLGLALSRRGKFSAAARAFQWQR